MENIKKKKEEEEESREHNEKKTGFPFYNAYLESNENRHCE